MRPKSHEDAGLGKITTETAPAAGNTTLGPIDSLFSFFPPVPISMREASRLTYLPIAPRGKQRLLFSSLPEGLSLR